MSCNGLLQNVTMLSEPKSKHNRMLSFGYEKSKTLALRSDLHTSVSSWNAMLGVRQQKASCTRYPCNVNIMGIDIVAGAGTVMGVQAWTRWLAQAGLKVYP